MLKFACRRFRAEFTPGLDAPHRKSCPACAAYAAAMERAARRLPLPESLRSRLRAIPSAGSGEGPRMPLPQAPLPNPLRDRLRGIARRQEPQPLPAWVRSSRYAVAASYVLALLVGAAVGNPLDLGREAADAAGTVSTRVGGRLERMLSGAEIQGRERLDAWESAVRERYGETRKSVEESLGNLETRVDELQSLIPSIPWN